MKKNLYTTGSIKTAILSFAFPFLGGMVLQNLYGAVDLFVTGQFASTADVSAVTIGSQLMNMVTQLVIGLATGVTVLIGRQFGARQEEMLAHTIKSAAKMFAVIAVILTAVYMVALKPIIKMMQTPDEAVEEAESYLFICAVGIIFIVGYNLLSSIWMGLGNTRTPLIFIAIACFVNIVLDVVLVKGFDMGAVGAAIATTLAQAVSFISAIIHMSRGDMGFKNKKKGDKGKNNLIPQIVKIGSPVAIQNVLVGVSFLFITAIINKMSLEASAAAGVVEKLFGFFIMPAVSFSSAVSTISAQNIGAGNDKRALKSMYTGIIMSLIPSIVITLFCVFKGELFTQIFSKDQKVIELASLYLKSYILDCIVVCFVFCMNGYFNGCGYSWFSMVHSLIATFAFRIPLSSIFSKLENTSLYIVGWAAPLSTVVSLILCCVFMIYITRKSKRKEKLDTTT